MLSISTDGTASTGVHHSCILPRASPAVTDYGDACNLLSAGSDLTCATTTAMASFAEAAAHVSTACLS